MLTETLVGAAAVWGVYKIRKLDTRIRILEQLVTSLKEKSPSLVADSPPVVDSLARQLAVAKSAAVAEPAAEPAPVKAPPRPASPLVNAAAPPVAKVELAKTPAASKPTPGPTPSPSAWSQSVDSAFSFVKANPFASLGVLLLLVGVSFLFSLLSANNILPPALRVALIAAVGLGAFAYGLKVEKRRPSFAVNLQGGALAIEFLSILWAYQGYHLVSAGTAFAWMAGLSSAAVGWAAYTRRGLFAFMGIIGALLTPIVASTGNGEFSSLALYTGWISVLALGIAAHLRTPFLATAALSGVSLLLAGAMRIEPGSSAITLAALLAMLLGYSNTALAWTRERFTWSARQRTSVIALLVAAPIIFVGFLGARTDVTDELCAGVLGVIALSYLASLYRAPQEWKGWLLSIGACFSLVAIGVGLEGASRAMAFSTTAFALMLISRTTKYTWAGVGAFCYWIWAVLYSLAALRGFNGMFGAHLPVPSNTLPVILTAVAALGAGYLNRGGRLSRAYTLLAVPLLALASLYHFDVPVYAPTLWTLVWGLSAMAVGTRLDWHELRLSATWVAPAALALLFSPPSHIASSLLVREIVLVGAVAMSVWLVSRYRADQHSAFSRLSQGNLATLSLVVPALVSLEINSLMAVLSMPWALFSSLVALVWASWTFATKTVRDKVQIDLNPEVAGAITLALTAVNVVFVDPTRMSQAALWAGILLLLRSTGRGSTKAGGQFARGVYVLAGGAAICTALQVIGGLLGYPNTSTLSLLFTLEMQPWVSILWAAGGVALVAHAAKRKSRKQWMQGGALLVALLAKMMLVDLGTLSLTAKVGVFLVTGVAFMALGRYSPAPPDKADTGDQA